MLPVELSALGDSVRVTTATETLKVAMRWILTGQARLHDPNRLVLVRPNRGPRPNVANPFLQAPSARIGHARTPGGTWCGR